MRAIYDMSAYTYRSLPGEGPATAAAVETQLKNPENVSGDAEIAQLVGRIDPASGSPKKGGDWCFVPGTLVHTKNGLVPIAEIRIGDWVLSQPELKGEKAFKRVKDTFVFEDKEVLLLKFVPVFESERARKTGTLNRRETYQYFVVTANHPFWMENIGWTRAGSLELGEQVELSDGTLAYIHNVDPIYQTGVANVGWAPSNGDMGSFVGNLVDLCDGKPRIEDGSDDLAPGFDPGNEDKVFTHRVHNIEIEDFHTYYVGELGVWVHNDDCRVIKAQVERNRSFPSNNPADPCHANPT